MGCGSSKNKIPTRNIRHAEPVPYNLSSFNPYPLPDHPIPNVTENNTFRLITDEARKIYNPVGLTRFLTIPADIKGVVVTPTKDLHSPIDSLYMWNPDGTRAKVHWRNVYYKKKKIHQEVWQGDTFRTVQVKGLCNVRLKGEHYGTPTARFSSFSHQYQILVQFDKIYEGVYVWLDYEVTSLYDRNALTSTQFERHCQTVINEFVVDQTVNAVGTEEKMSQRYTEFHRLTTVGITTCYRHPSGKSKGYLDADSVVWLVAPEVSQIFPSDKRIFVYVPNGTSNNDKFAWIDKRRTSLLRDFWMKNDEENVVIGTHKNGCDVSWDQRVICYLEGYTGHLNEMRLKSGWMVKLLSRTLLKVNGYNCVKVQVLKGEVEFIGSVAGQICFMDPYYTKWHSKTDFVTVDETDGRFYYKTKYGEVGYNVSAQ